MELLDIIGRNDAIRAIILTGAGERAFCAGADIVGFARSVRQGQGPALCEFVGPGQRMTSRIESFPKPIIVAVNGLAHGGGEIVEAARWPSPAIVRNSARPRYRLVARRRSAARSACRA